MNGGGWIVAVLRRDSEQVTVLEPSPYPGIDAERITVELLPGEGFCDESLSSDGLTFPCGLIAGHVGPHWKCTPELVVQMAGPAQLVAHLDVS